jgi:hypothetical protein
MDEGRSFIGREAMERQLAAGTARQLIGLVMMRRACFGTVRLSMQIPAKVRFSQAPFLRRYRRPLPWRGFQQDKPVRLKSISEASGIRFGP